MLQIPSAIRRAAAATCVAVAACLSLWAQAADVVIVAGQKVYHSAVCSQTAVYNASYLRTVKRDTLGADFTACAVCRPDNPAAAAPSAAAAPLEKELEELWSRYDATEPVFIVLGDRTTGLYHRRGCHWTRSGQNQVFSRKDADSRYFQPHPECMRRPPDSFTQAAEDALRTGKPEPVRSLVATPTPTTSPPAATAGTATTTPTTPAPSGPRLMDTERKQCAATTKKGTRCSRMAQPGRSYCWQHP
jgi:hypothetical protein